MNKPVIKYTVCNVTLKKVYTIVWGQLDFLIIIKYFYFEAFFLKLNAITWSKVTAKSFIR